MLIKRFPIIVCLFLSQICLAQSISPIELSINFLSGLKEDSNVESHVRAYEDLSLRDLQNLLDSDAKKMSFWINTYNGFILYILKKNPELYQDRTSFFKKKQVSIGGTKMSFENIEHGILRRSQIPYFLGYISNPFAPAWVKNLRVDQLDYRIHFALNCGAKSCPPVQIYTHEQFDNQLDISSQSFLKKTTQYEPKSDHAKVVALFSWFRGDFGGGQGIRAVLFKYKATPKRPSKVSTTPYDWTLDLNNWW